MILYCAAVSSLTLGAQEQQPILLQNPRLLQPPASLLQAQMVSELTTATLRDANGSL